MDNVAGDGAAGPRHQRLGRRGHDPRSDPLPDWREIGQIIDSLDTVDPAHGSDSAGNPSPPPSFVQTLINRASSGPDDELVDLALDAMDAQASDRSELTTVIVAHSDIADDVKTLCTALLQGDGARTALQALAAADPLQRLANYAEAELLVRRDQRHLDASKAYEREFTVHPPALTSRARAVTAAVDAQAWSRVDSLLSDPMTRNAVNAWDVVTR